VNRWDNGAIRQTVVFNPETNITVRNSYNPDGTTERIEKYDSFGNKFETSFYDASGNLRESIDGWAAKRVRFIGGKVFQETTYGSDGKPKERKTFDEFGRLIARQFLNSGSSDPEDILRKEPAYGQHVAIFYNSNGQVEQAANIVNE
jgi:antitoxin component YwqK of YwqJK toxin-antitoxin module